MHRDTLKLLLLKIYKIGSMHCETSLPGTAMYFTFQQHYLSQEFRFSQRANSSKINKANCRDLFCAIFVILFIQQKNPPFFCAFLSKLPFSTTFRPMPSISRFYHGNINYISGEKRLSPFYSTHFSVNSNFIPRFFIFRVQE